MSSVSDRLAEIAGRIGQIGEQLTDLQQAVEASRASLNHEPEAADSLPQPAVPAGQPENELVSQALGHLAHGKTQEQILEVFLEEAQPFVSRAILFLLRDGQYVTWKGFGFEPENIREIALDDPMDSVVRSAQQRQLIYRRDHAADSFPWLSQAGDLPNCTLCIPLVFENSAPVVFYADSKDPIAIDTLELLSRLTVLVLKNNYLHQLVNAQKEAAGEATVAEETAAASPVAAEAPAQEPQPTEEDQEEAWQEPEEPEQPEVASQLEAPAPSEQWVEFGAEAQPPQAEAPAEPPPEAEYEGEPALEAEPAQEEEPSPEAEPSPDFDIPSDSKEIDFDEELEATEREIDFDIDLDTTPEIEDWQKEVADEEDSAAAPSESEQAVQAEAEEPSEDLEFQPFGTTPVEQAPPQEGQQAEQLEEGPPDEVPEQDAQPVDLTPESYPPLPSEEEAAPEAEAVPEEAAPEEEAAVEAAIEPEAAAPEAEEEAAPEDEEEAAPEPEPPSEPQPQEAVEAEPSEPAPPAEEDKKAHDEARRFARLLVSEIKLYNEDDVEAGRQNANLYQRLSRDINRSREMYQKRVNPAVAGSVDYFHEEVVRILAKGEASLLGSDYPGPQTED